jgi:hypothetical protein
MTPSMAKLVKGAIVGSAKAAKADSMSKYMKEAAALVYEATGGGLMPSPADMGKIPGKHIPAAIAELRGIRESERRRRDERIEEILTFHGSAQARTLPCHVLSLRVLRWPWPELCVCGAFVGGSLPLASPHPPSCVSPTVSDREKLFPTRLSHVESAPVAGVICVHTRRTTWFGLCAPFRSRARAALCEATTNTGRLTCPACPLRNLFSRSPS